MRIILACECSGIMREEFKKRGHDAHSCDLKPSEIPGKHIQDNILKHLNENWDMMIGFPPCTFLTYAATSSWNNEGRARERLKALKFFLDLWEAPIEKICLENPLGCIEPVIIKYDQIIHPYYFGDHEMKRTCLWLKNLPPLKYVSQDNLFEKGTFTDKPDYIYQDKSGKKRYYTDAISGMNNGAEKRARSFPGIARAMAEQWG